MKIVVLVFQSPLEFSSKGNMTYLVKMFAVAVLVASAKANDCKTSTSTSTSETSYWTKYFESKMTVLEAAHYCTSQEAFLGVIYNETSYDEIVEDARRELRENNVVDEDCHGFWTGANYDAVNSKMHPYGAFNGNWRPGYPESDPDFTGVLVSVKLDPASPNQGLVNLDPTQKRAGVVCWTRGSGPIPESCDVEGELKANPENPCSEIYYQCANKVWVEKTCPSGLVFNEAIDACDWPYNVPACN